MIQTLNLEMFGVLTMEVLILLKLCELKSMIKECKSKMCEIEILMIEIEKGEK